MFQTNAEIIYPTIDPVSVEIITQCNKSISVMIVWYDFVQNNHQSVAGPVYKFCVADQNHKLGIKE